MKTLEFKGLTLFAVIWECIILGGFIYATQFGNPNLIQAYEWFFYFVSALCILSLFFPAKLNYRYTKIKYQWEIITDVLLGLLLAYHGYFFCASVLTLIGWSNANHRYYINED